MTKPNAQKGFTRETAIVAGRRSSAAKTRAARRNGRLGGRPSARARRGPEETWRFWHTHPEVFDPLNREFGPFTLDAAASPENALAPCFYQKGVNGGGLAQPWAPERVWCSPPYDTPTLEHFVRKGYAESLKGALVVMLVPATRTDRPWWHDTVVDGGAEVRFLKGRIKSIRQDGKIGQSPGPCCVVIFRPPKAHA